MVKRTYLLIGANTSSLPKELPAWLIALTDKFGTVWEAIFNTEQLLSIVVESGDDERSKTQRCAQILREFAGANQPLLGVIIREFVEKRSSLDPEFAHAIGIQIAAISITCSNMQFRGQIMHEVVDGANEWRAPESCVFMCLAESCRNQTGMLDFLRKLVVPMQTVSECGDVVES